MNIMQRPTSLANCDAFERLFKASPLSKIVDNDWRRLDAVDTSGKNDDILCSPYAVFKKMKKSMHKPSNLDMHRCTVQVTRSDLPRHVHVSNDDLQWDDITPDTQAGSDAESIHLDVVQPMSARNGSQKEQITRQESKNNGVGQAMLTRNTSQKEHTTRQELKNNDVVKAMLTRNRSEKKPTTRHEFNSNDLANKEKISNVEPSSRKKNSKMNNSSKPQDKNVIVLEDWIIILSKSGISVDGRRVGDKPGAFWHSSVVAERSSNHVVHTQTGTTYQLQGTICNKDAIESGCPRSMALAFRHGFPMNWRELVEKHIEKSYPSRTRSAVKTQQKAEKSDSLAPERLRKAKKSTTSHQKTEHSDNKASTSLLSITDLPRSRSGRHLIPALAWWCGQRVDIRRDSIDINPGNPNTLIHSPFNEFVSTSQVKTELTSSGSSSTIRSDRNQDANGPIRRVSHKKQTKRASSVSSLEEEEKEVEDDEKSDTETGQDFLECSNNNNKNNARERGCKVQCNGTVKRQTQKKHTREIHRADTPVISSPVGVTVDILESARRPHPVPRLAARSRHTMETDGDSSSTGLSRSTRNRCRSLRLNKTSQEQDRRNYERQKELLSMKTNKRNTHESTHVDTEINADTERVPPVGRKQKPPSGLARKQCKTTKRVKKPHGYKKNNCSSGEEENEHRKETWTADECNRLQNALSSTEADTTNFWDVVAHKVRTRDAQQCQQRHYMNVPEATAAPTRKTKSDQPAVCKVADLTGKSGTLKRKRQLRDLVNYHEAQAFNDDFFNSTPYKPKKTVKLSEAIAGNDSGDDFFRLGHATPGATPSGGADTPFTSLHKAWWPVSERKTPSTHLTTAMSPLQNSINRNEVDLYVNRFKKKMKVRKIISQQNEATVNTKSSFTGEPYEIPKDVFARKPVAATHHESDSDDYYFSDSE